MKVCNKMAIILLDTYKQGDERYSICRDTESNKIVFITLKSNTIHYDPARPSVNVGSIMTYFSKDEIEEWYKWLNHK